MKKINAKLMKNKNIEITVTKEVSEDYVYQRIQEIKRILEHIKRQREQFSIDEKILSDELMQLEACLTCKVTTY